MNYLAIDIGGTKIKYGLLADTGQKLFSATLKTPQSLSSFKAALSQLISEYQAQVAGVAISVPGKVDSYAGIVYHGGALPFLDGLNFKELVAQVNADLTFALQNDGKAGALAEKWQGSLQAYDNACAIILGTAVGGGIILNGKIYAGSHHQAGEFSYLPSNIYAQGFDRLSGTSGSAVQMIERAAAKLGLVDLQDGPTVFAQIKQQNSKVWPIFQEYCQAVAYLVLGLQAVLDLEAYTIGGGISANEILLTEINRAYDRLSGDFPFEKPAIKQATLQNDANLYGALYQLLTTQKG